MNDFPFIRKMDMTDVRFVFEQEQRLFHSSLGESMLIKDILYNDMAHYYVAFDQDQRIGYIGCWLTQPNAEILNMFVLEEFRNKGVASSLLKKVFELCEAESIQQLTLEVRPSNKQAIQLYKKYGFTHSHTRQQYYKDHEDASVMIKQVGETK